MNDGHFTYSVFERSCEYYAITKWLLNSRLLNKLTKSLHLKYKPREESRRTFRPPLGAVTRFSLTEFREVIVTCDVVSIDRSFSATF